MKVSLYSNRLDNIYNQLTSSRTSNLFTQTDFFSMKNNINSITNVYANEDEMFEKYSKDYNFRKKMKKEGGKAISDFLIGMKKGVVMENFKDRKSIIENVVNRNRNEKKKRVNFDKLTAELSHRYNSHRDQGVISTNRSSNVGTERGSKQVDNSNRDEYKDNKNLFKNNDLIHIEKLALDRLNTEDNKNSKNKKRILSKLESKIKNTNITNPKPKNKEDEENENKIYISTNPYNNFEENYSQSHLSTQIDSQIKLKFSPVRKAGRTLSKPESEYFIQNLLNTDRGGSNNFNLTNSSYYLTNNTNLQTPTSCLKTPNNFIMPSPEKSINPLPNFNSNSSQSNNNDFVKIVHFKDKNSFIEPSNVNSPERKLYKIEEVNSPESVVRSERRIEFSNSNSNTNSNYAFSKRNSKRNSTVTSEFDGGKTGSIIRRSGRSKTILEDILTKTDSPTRLEFLNSPLIKKGSKGLINHNIPTNSNSNNILPPNSTKHNSQRKNSVLFNNINSPLNKIRKNPTTPGDLESEIPTRTAERKLTKKKTIKASSKKIEKSNNPQFKNSMALNKYLIRDFLIGEKNDPTGSSKKKMELTNKMFDYIEERKKKKIKAERNAYEINKYGAIITEDPNSSAEDKNIFLSMQVESKEEDKLQAELKILNKKNKEKIDERSKKVGEMIQNISNDEYEDVNSKDRPLKSSNPVNLKNLERVIRVRNILKKKMDLESDFLGIQDIDKFKESRRENDNELMMTLKKLGPPSFLKTRFRNKTIEKYKIVNGKYFGCKV